MDFGGFKAVEGIETGEGDQSSSYWGQGTCWGIESMVSPSFSCSRQEVDRSVSLPFGFQGRQRKSLQHAAIWISSEIYTYGRP